MLYPVVSDSLWPHGLQHARLFITNFQSLLKLISIELVMPSSHLIPLQFPSPPTFSLCQHQGLFQWVVSLHHVAKILEFQLQHQSFQWIFRTEFHNGQILFNNKKDKFVLRGASWVNLENILRQKISQTHWAWFYKLFRKCISIRIKRYRWLQWARGGRMGSNFLQIREFLWGDENTINTGDGCMNLSL